MIRRLARILAAPDLAVMGMVERFIGPPESWGLPPDALTEWLAALAPPGPDPAA